MEKLNYTNLQMRALFLCPSPFGVGTYHRALAFAQFFHKELKMNVDLICSGDIDQERMVDGVRIIQIKPVGPGFGKLRGFKIGEVFKRAAWILKADQKFDLIYTFEYQPTVAWLGFPLAKVQGAIHINDWCDWYAGRHHKMKNVAWLQKVDSWLEEGPRKHADLVTVICQALYDRALASGVAKDRLLLIGEGAEAPKNILNQFEAKKKLGIPESVFLCVAMMDVEVSMMRTAAEKCAQLWPSLDRADSTEFKFALIGDLQAAGAATESILTPGRVTDEDLHLWLCAADCAWLPLRASPLNEGRLPHKIGHYRSYGLPLVTNAASVDIANIQDDGVMRIEFDVDGFVRTTSELQRMDVLSRQDQVTKGQKSFAWKNILGPLLFRMKELVNSQEPRK